MNIIRAKSNLYNWNHNQEKFYDNKFIFPVMWYAISVRKYNLQDWCILQMNGYVYNIVCISMTRLES